MNEWGDFAGPAVAAAAAPRAADGCHGDGGGAYRLAVSETGTRVALHSVGSEAPCCEGQAVGDAGLLIALDCDLCHLGFWCTPAAVEETPG